MDLHRTLRALRQRWWVVLLTVIVALGAAGFVTVRTPPRYAATVTFFVTMPEQNANNAYQGGLFLQQRLKSYADLLTSDRLTQKVADQPETGLSAREVQRRLSARPIPDTVLLAVTVTDTDRARSLRLAEVLSVQFIRLIEEIETPPGASKPAIKVNIVSGPRAEPGQVAPRPVRNLTLAGLLGLLLGVGLALLRSITDNTVRDGATLEQIVSAPLLGEIPFDGGSKNAPLVVGEAARSARAEALRKLRTNLRFVDAEEPARVIAVTSAVQAEGKTTLSCNLAIALAEAGWQVLLVDADLRRPRVSHYLGLGGGAGLTDVLIGDLTPEDVVQPWADLPLLVLPAGSVPPNPSELLGSKAMADLLLHLRGMADIVIIDTPPLLAVTDGVVVAVQTDGALLVTRYGRTTRARATAAAQALHAVDARLLGCVLNMTKVSKADAHQYLAYRVDMSAKGGAPAEARAQADVAEPAVAEQTGTDGGEATATAVVGAETDATSGDQSGASLGDVDQTAAPATDKLSRIPR